MRLFFFSQIFLLLFFCFLSANAQNCTMYDLTNCASCTNQTGCGWCTTVQQCMNGSLSGPTNPAICLGNAWQFGIGTCIRCETIQDCRQCLANQADCGWCSQTMECLPLDEFGSRLGMKCKAPAAACACNMYTSCDQCLLGANCQWCQSDLACRDLTTTCTSGPGYNKTVGCQCDTNMDCPSCQDGFNCQWCQNSGTCQLKGTQNGCMPSLGTCSAYCALAGNASCTKCNNINGCGWCPSKKLVLI